MPTVGTGIGRRHRLGTSAPTGPVSDSAITSARADSWSVAYTAPPTMDPAGSPRYLALSRAGYSSAGIATSHVETLVLTKRVRQPYPAQASLDASRVALSDYVYATDTILGGAANAAVEVSPKPVANWALPDHRVVGNSLRLELVAAHRNARAGKEVACVEFRATDGTSTVTQIVSASSVLGHPGDLNAVVGYACDLDITSLSVGPVTANARVFPWIGGAASVLNSSDSSAAREFSPQTYLKNVALAANPVFVYVNSGGNDTTGAVSTTAATAEASPCATPAGAINRAIAVYGSVDGVVIRLMAGTHAMNTSAIIATRTQTTGECIITRDPNATRSGVILQFGATASSRFRFGTAGGWLRFADISLTRQGTFSLLGEATSPLRVRFDQVNFDNNNVNAAIYSNSDGIFTGCTFVNLAASMLNAGAREHRLLRGVSAVSSGSSVEGWLVLGCNFDSCGPFTTGARSASGSIVAFNQCRRLYSGGPTIPWGLSADVSGYAVLQNLFEFTSATGSTTIGLSHDAATGNNTHGVVHHNTLVGFFINGRSNLFYEDGATARVSKLHSCIGNIHVQLNTKGDVFVSNGARTGNWAYLYGVGCRGEFSQFIDANSGGIGTPFAQEYPGLDASIGTSATVRNDPLFTDDKGTVSTSIAGAGGGDYALQAGSPAISRVKAPVLAFDLAGTPRSATASAAGAYESLVP